MSRISVWRNKQRQGQMPAKSRDLGLEFTFAEVMPSARKWMRKQWLAEEWPRQQIGFNRVVFDKEVGGAIKRIQRTATTTGIYLKGAEAELMGWATWERLDDGTLVVYFAYTKPYYRQCGVFRALLEHIGYDFTKGFVTSSWAFAAGNHAGRKKRLNAHFNPYILLRRAYHASEEI